MPEWLFPAASVVSRRREEGGAEMRRDLAVEYVDEDRPLIEKGLVWEVFGDGAADNGMAALAGEGGAYISESCDSSDDDVKAISSCRMLSH
jgi:hypothetical protein